VAPELTSPAFDPNATMRSDRPFDANATIRTERSFIAERRQTPTEFLSNQAPWKTGCRDGGCAGDVGIWLVRPQYLVGQIRGNSGTRSNPRK